MTRNDAEFATLSGAFLACIASAAYLLIGRWKAAAVSGWAGVTLFAVFAVADAEKARKQKGV